MINIPKVPTEEIIDRLMRNYRYGELNFPELRDYVKIVYERVVKAVENDSRTD